MSQVLSSGRRKYTDILDKLVSQQVCKVECRLADARTIIDGVKKEKVKWVKRKAWPAGRALKIDIVETPAHTGVSFRMILDTSVNNL